MGASHPPRVLSAALTTISPPIDIFAQKGVKCGILSPLNQSNRPPDICTHLLKKISPPYHLFLITFLKGGRLPRPPPLTLANSMFHRDCLFHVFCLFESKSSLYLIKHVIIIIQRFYQTAAKPKANQSEHVKSNQNNSFQSIRLKPDSHKIRQPEIVTHRVHRNNCR